jgi:hypothetical protein
VPPTAAAQPERAPQQKSPNALTEYVVLEAVRVRHDALAKALGALPEKDGPSENEVLPPGLHTDADGYITLWLPLRNEKAQHGPDGGVRVVRANAPANAVKQATKVGGEDGVQRQGSFKSVPLRSWKGGRTYKNKSKVVTDAEDYED